MFFFVWNANLNKNFVWIFCKSYNFLRLLTVLNFDICDRLMDETIANKIILCK